MTPSRGLWRIHRADRDARWFCSDLQCRFDLPVPRGTCYLAPDPLASFLEVFREIEFITPEVIAKRRLSELRVPTTLRLADCASSHARGFGCTGEIHTSIDYRLTQEWAQAFAAARFAGIRYLVRHDPSQRLLGIAIFGPAGFAEDWPESSPHLIGSDLLREAGRKFRIRTTPPP
ncbi:MAG: RES domain-containing protein [Candidatus Binatia bacterium]